jgi:hypothetical protein
LQYDDTTLSEHYLVCNAKVYEAAEFYVIPSLIKLAVAKFEVAATRQWSSYQFLKVVDYIYDSTLSSYEQLRAIVIQIAVTNQKELLEDEGFTELLSNYAELGKDFTIRLLPVAKKIENLMKAMCRDCHRIL